MLQLQQLAVFGFLQQLAEGAEAVVMKDMLELFSLKMDLEGQR
ncbi:hypothetical protein [Pelagibius marinus]|nr:hypothetical protein [Pelagibius marinus]